jgi:hypothetical protein
MKQMGTLDYPQKKKKKKKMGTLDTTKIHFTSLSSLNHVIDIYLVELCFEDAIFKLS